jgi:hypothetical protein
MWFAIWNNRLIKMNDNKSITIFFVLLCLSLLGLFVAPMLTDENLNGIRGGCMGIIGCSWGFFIGKFIKKKNMEFLLNLF